ncbi:hypothetical protein [Paracoccus jiaweipingae]|uniref:hypothetical protein n=1 Tax=unclassified Paracoccus (in: a-proteobacteria) TaxID=2688777 RepID=UPI0037A6C1D1
MQQTDSGHHALSFTDDAVHLNVWRDGRWLPVAQAGFDAPQVATLRRAIAPADGSDPAVTVILPPDQLLYTRLTVAPRPQAVRDALVGLTPYPVADLAFDWQPDDTGVQVAALVRQTLHEARDFVTRHGFAISDFTATPEPQQFPRPPVFTLTPGNAPDWPTAPAATPAVPVAAPAKAPTPVVPAHDAALPAPISAIPPHYIAPSATAAKTDAGTSPEPTMTPLPPTADRQRPDAAPTALKIGGFDGRGPAATQALPDPGDAAGVTAASIPLPLADTAPDQPPQTDNATATRAVIRHAAPASAPAEAVKPLPARAQAVLDRAAAARAVKSVAPHSAAPAKAGARRDLPAILPLLAGLVVAILAVWIFAPGSPAPDPAQPDRAAVTAPRTNATTAPPPATEAPQPRPATASAPRATAAISPLTTATGAAVPPAPIPQAQRRAAPAAQAGADSPQTDGTAQTTPSGTTAPAPTQPPAATAGATPPRSPVRPASRPGPRPAASGTAAPDQDGVTAAPRNATGLTRSARPGAAPSRAAPAAARDAAPSVPQNPLPFEASRTPTPRVDGSRPRQRPGTTSPTQRAAPAAPPVAAPQPATDPQLNRSPRPQSRPARQGALVPDQAPVLALTASIGTDLARRALPGGSYDPLRLARVADDAPRHAALLDTAMMFGQQAAPVVLAQVRPTRKPRQSAAPAPDRAGSAGQSRAIDSALTQAMDQSERPPATHRATGSTAALPDSPATPALTTSGGLRVSARPARRGQGAARAGGAGNPSTANLSGSAVEGAIAAAIADTALSPGNSASQVLASSPIPPRRSGRVSPPAATQPETAAPPARAGTGAAAPADPDDPSPAELAARLRQDEQLQAQAEARARARAAADAKAEAQARAAAEARARAQAAAEERAAAARNQTYVPQELDNEPEIRGAEGVAASGSVARAATQNRAMDTRRTQLIGVIGAGKASRGLIRLRNGKVVTVRIGDRIDGGTINAIGDGRVQYVKSGRAYQLTILNGR